MSDPRDMLSSLLDGDVDQVRRDIEAAAGQVGEVFEAAAEGRLRFDEDTAREVVSQGAAAVAEAAGQGERYRQAVDVVRAVGDMDGGDLARLVSTAGTAAGADIGFWAGGPLGATIGGALGSLAGDAVSSAVGEVADWLGDLLTGGAQGAWRKPDATYVDTAYRIGAPAYDGRYRVQVRQRLVRGQGEPFRALTQLATHVWSPRQGQWVPLSRLVGQTLYVPADMTWHGYLGTNPTSLRSRTGAPERIEGAR